MANHAATETLWGGLLLAVKDIFYLWFAVFLYYLLAISEMCPGG